jgi:hypothetical protein
MDFWQTNRSARDGEIDDVPTADPLKKLRFSGT